MKAHELRIGNWVYISDKCGYLPIKTDCIDLSDWDNDLFAPVPLTPEILQKCGFKEVPSIKNKWELDDFIGPDLNFYFENGELIPDDCYTGQTVMINIKYLHQLQNLYFALTGIELPIEL